MPKKNEYRSTITPSFQEYLAEVESKYLQQLKTIDLHDVSKTAHWTAFQKKSFAEIFYHLRGHFINFMWFLGNNADDELTKNIVLENIKEEFGAGKFSHEKLYARFAAECGVDINDEILNETSYQDFAKNFNKEHISWLASHDLDEQLAAFAAYERLDNIDYPFLTELAKSINISTSGMTFFRVHTNVEHFSSTFERLLPIWEKSPEKIKLAFDFIFSHQLNMWGTFSKVIFSL